MHKKEYEMYGNMNMSENREYIKEEEKESKRIAQKFKKKTELNKKL